MSGLNILYKAVTWKDTSAAQVLSNHNIKIQVEEAMVANFMATVEHGADVRTKEDFNKGKNGETALHAFGNSIEEAANNLGLAFLQAASGDAVVLTYAPERNDVIQATAWTKNGEGLKIAGHAQIHSANKRMISHTMIA